jgi:zinc/manganese transport system substrate-binding protein
MKISMTRSLKTGWFLASCLFSVLVQAQTVWAQLNVVTTTEDIASLVQVIGGKWVNVESLSRGYQDTHFVQAKPSLMIIVHKADLLIYQGMELEVGWLPLLIRGSRNPKVFFGQPGNLDLSLSIDPIEVPQGALDRSMGDVHAFGNPHYNLGPSNIKPMLFMLSDHLSELDPAHEVQFKSNRNSFIKKFNARLAEWKQRMAPFKGKQVVTFHRTWSYFLREFGMHYVGTLEPVPGIQPSPSHLIRLSQLMKAENVRLILQANYYRDKFANLLADKTGAQVLALPPGVGGVPEAGDTIKLFDYLINKITKALSENE